MNFSDGNYYHHPMVDYVNAMDPKMYQGETAQEQAPQLGINEIGMSVPMGISAQNVAGIYSKIRMGAGNIEIGFPGAISGTRQAQTPGMYGKDQRRAIRELGMINEVKFTTHSAYNLMGMTGQDQQGNFSMDRGRLAQREVERAIDFAADTAGGGSVVVHTGEFNRPLSHMDQTGMDFSRDKNGFLMFRKHPAEPFNAQFELVDKRNGQVMKTVQLDRLVARPVWLRHHGTPIKGKYQMKTPKRFKHLAGKGTTIEDGDYVDYEGNKLFDPFDSIYGRVPVFNKETGRFDSEYKHFDDFKEEAEEKNAFNKKEKGRELTFQETITPVEAFLHATLEIQEGHSRGWALQYGLRAGEHISALKELRKAREFYFQLDKNLPEEEKWKIMKSDPHLMRFVGEIAGRLLPPKTSNPLEIIDRAINEQQKEVEFARQASTSQELQAYDTAETKNNIVEPIKYIEERAIRHYTEAALHAMQKTKDPNNPVVLAMENIFPEKFGGHPQELKWIIQEARKQFVDYLTEPTGLFMASGKDREEYERISEDGIKPIKTTNPWYNSNITKEEAEKLAERHIKATLDTGHAFLWKRFWDPRPGLTPEQNEAEFKKWYLKQIEDLAKNKMVGNVHLTDNFGYQDDHLAPGQGNVPVKDVIDILKKHGYDRAITTEPGADASTDISDFHGLMKTWRHFGSPVYGVGMRIGAPQSWGDIHYSYFGQNKPPYYIFGAYAPSNDWTLWSAVPME